MAEALRKLMSSAYRWVIQLAAVFVLLGMTGCGGGANRGFVKIATQQQTVNQLTIALEMPERPQLLAEQELLIRLTDVRGAPVDGAEVWLGLIMPSHQMSPNEPDAMPAGNGRYRAKAIFTMAGTWNLEVHATVQGQEHVVTFHAQTS